MIFNRRKSDRPALVWMVVDRSQRITVPRLILFAMHAFRRQCVVVLPPIRRKKWRLRVLRWLVRFGLIRQIDSPEPLDFFYSSEDVIVTKLSEKFARQVVSDVAEATRDCPWPNLVEAERSRIFSALRLAIADAFYANLRSALGFKIMLQSEIGQNVEVYDPQFSRLNEGDNLSVELCIDPEEMKSRYSIVGLENINNNFDSLIVGSVNRLPYIDTAAFIENSEGRLGRSVALLMPGNPLGRPNSDYFSKRVSMVTFYIKKRSQVSNPMTSFKRIDFKIPLADFSGLGHAAWLAQRHARMVIDNRLPDLLARLTAQYLEVRDRPEFDHVSMVFASPSRSPVVQPVLELLRERGARVVEYQAFFWSAHPRYEVRDLDLFVCSDKATMQIVKDKYRVLGSDTPVILGPSFGMAEFLDRFKTALDARASEGGGDVARYDIGVALQPTGLEQFEQACATLNQMGLRLLIRAHPVMNRESTEQQFGQYGVIDTETLEDFLIDSAVVVTGFSNVAVQATACGRAAVCLPQPEGLGLDLSVASDRIAICETMDDLPRLVQSARSLPFDPPVASAMEQWLKIRSDLDAGVYDRPGRPRAGTPTTV